MKIGILTYFGDLNCGTNLQAYSTLSAVQKIFPQSHVEIINYHSFRPDVKPYLTDATPRTLYNDLIRILKYKQFKKENLKVSRDHIIRDVKKGLQFIANQKYDRIYIGADTLLELDRLPKKQDGLTAYWLSPDISGQKYLLAASCKNVQYEQLSERQKADMKATLENFSKCAVRDKTTQRLLSHFIPEQEITLIPDPTFTLNIDYSYTQNYLRKKKIEFNSPIICIHALKDDIWPKKLAQVLKSQGYKIASLRPAHWADYVFNDMSPLEQLGIYKYFQCLITHRFHDTIFSIKNNTPVISYAQDLSYSSKLGESKYSDLLDLFDLKNECFIQDRSKITVELLMNKIPVCIQTFKNKHVQIGDKKKELKEKYYDFLRLTI